MSHMKHSQLADDVYFILNEGEVVDWTDDLEEARRWEASDGYQYVRYSKNRLERKPFERVREDDYQQFETVEN